MDILETARLLRFQTDWERRWHHYCLLEKAGLSPKEALRIVTQAEADREAEAMEHERKAA